MKTIYFCNIRFVYLSLSVLLSFYSFIFRVNAQLPDCVDQAEIIYILKSNGEILNWNSTTFPPVTTIANTISAPINGGLAVCDRLPQRDYKTFYVVGGFPPYYQYHDGTNWVNTGHLAGPNASNIAGAGKYIYNLNGINGIVYRYDGTNNDEPILSLPVWGGPFDLAGDSEGNFYILKTNSSGNTTRWFRKYDPDGTMLQQWEIIGGGTSIPGQSLGGCLAVICRDVYFHNGTNLYHGTIDGDTINFTEYGNFGAGADYGSCERIPKTKNVDSVVCNNQIPFTWNGQQIIQTGKYTHVIQDVNTICDSVIFLNLTVEDTLKKYIDSTICEQDLPFIWEEYNIVTNGNHNLSANTTTLFGCDSITNINLSVIPMKTKEIDSVICEQNLPFIWGNYVVSEVGEHKLLDTFSLSNECDSIVTLTLQVFGENVNIVDTFLCNNAFPISWNNDLISEFGTYIDSNINVFGCDSLSILNVNIKCEVDIPNILSLSSNVGNNIWKIADSGFYEFHCKILNRWGNIVYELNNINEQWHGKDKNGNDLPEGIYFYSVSASFYDNSSIAKYGFISLER